MTAAATDTDLLARLISARWSRLVQLRDISGKQRELIEEGRMTALLDLLAAKQRPLRELQRVERALAPFRGQDPAARVWSSPADRAACAEQISRCEALLGEIVRSEKQCEEALLRRRDETAAQLAQFRLAGQVRGAYAAAPPAARHIDLCSER